MRKSHRKGMTIEEEYGIERAKEIRRKNIEGHKGQTPWNRNIPRTEAEKQKMSENRKGKGCGSDNCNYGKHPIPWNKDLKTGSLQRNSFTFTKGDIRLIGENNPNWKDGISREPYPFDFDDELRELIRRRDNYKCRKCGCPQEENVRKLSIHHRDYDKQNCDPKNLVSLCTVCHSEVNFDRDHWQSFFRAKIT